MKKVLLILLAIIFIAEILPSTVFGAENTVTLDLVNGAIDLYPTGYSQADKEAISFTGAYRITGSHTCDTPLDLYNFSGSTVTYNVTLDNATLKASNYCTAVRFTGDSDIILNLINIGTSKISTQNNHPVFRSYNSAAVTVNIINLDDSTLILNRINGTPTIFVPSQDTFITINGEEVTDEQNYTSGAYQIEAHAIHSYDQKVADENYLKSPATCNAKAVYYNSCVCGSSSAGTEYEATFEYGEIDSFNHINLVKTEAKEATHTTEGNVKYYSCNGCGRYFSDEDGTREITFSDTVIDRLSEHTVDETDWHSDENSHWNTCECGEKLNKSPHTFETVIEKEATETNSGYSHERCTVCGYEKASVEIPATDKPSIEASDADTETAKSTGEETIVLQMGDANQLFMAILLFMAAGVFLTVITIYKKYNR